MLVTLFALLFLTSCGFHPRGAVSLAPPLQRIYLQSPDPYGELVKNLKQSLKASGVYLATSPKDATTILQILQESEGQALTSIGGTQQTRQYNLTLTVSFQITDPNGRILVAPYSLSETRNITILANQILGGSNEANNLFQQMRRAMTFDIMNRISSQDVTTLLIKKKTNTPS